MLQPERVRDQPRCLEVELQSRPGTLAEGFAAHTQRRSVGARPGALRSNRGLHLAKIGAATLDQDAALRCHDPGQAVEQFAQRIGDDRFVVLRQGAEQLERLLGEEHHLVAGEGIGG